jgi:hypothetical protein
LSREKERTFDESSLKQPPFLVSREQAIALPAIIFAQLGELLRLLGHYVGASSSALMPIICPKLHYSKASANTMQEHPFKTWDLKAQTLANPDRLSNSVGDNDGCKGVKSPADEAATSVLIAECHAAHHYKLFLQCYLSSIRILFLSCSKGLRSVAPAVGAHDSSSAHGLPIPLSIRILFRDSHERASNSIPSQ